MQIVAIEGGDQAGKETQTKLLAQALRDRGFKVYRGGFPAYETAIGNLIDQVLHGRVQMNTLALTYLYEANKAEFQTLFADLERDGYDYLILDRYLLSALIYSRAKGLDDLLTHALQLPLRKPDKTFILDIDPIASRRRKALDTLDLHERDIPLLQRVRQEYRASANGRDILLIDADREPQTIHNEILGFLNPPVAQISAYEGDHMPATDLKPTKRMINFLRDLCLEAEGEVDEEWLNGLWFDECQQEIKKRG